METWKNLSPITKRRITWITALWITPVALWGVWWLSVWLWPGHKMEQIIDQWLMSNVLSFGAGFRLMVAIWCLATLILWLATSSAYVTTQSKDRYGYSHNETTRVRNTPVVFRVGLAAIIASLLASSVLTWTGFWDNDKDYGRYYNQDTVFYTPSLTAGPQSLDRLVNTAAPGDKEHCDLVGTADVPSCIKEGTLPETGWDARIGSLDGAQIALSRTSGDVQRVSLMTDSLTYLNASGDQPARWSGVMDGTDIQQPLGGVAEWTGSGTPTQCLFEGDYAIDRAIDGSRMNDLPDLLAETFPDLRWTTTDVWGYCNGQEPIVVIPVTKQVYWMSRTVDTAAGIIVVQGDHGHTKLTYKSTVTAGEYPGPVYPASLVAIQREESAWASGRQDRNRNGFGYDPATSDTQAGNVSEYLLRNSATGRLEWVTPLTLRSSSSELFVAYAVSPADEVNADSLNQLSIYVLADNDPRRINVDNLEADARNFLSNQEPGFIPSGGKLVEFTPIDGDIWRAFGELNGRVVYRMDISANNKIAPKLVNLDSNTQQAGSTTGGPSSGGTPATTGSSCGSDVTSLSATDLTNCLKQFADELAARQGG